MPGLIDLYVTTANVHISEHVRNGTPHRISRSRIEFEIMEELDKAPFATDLKVAWYFAILTPATFLSFWAGIRALHNLPPTCITPYVPDMTLLSYIAPPSPTSHSSTQTTTHRDPSIVNGNYTTIHPNGDIYAPTAYITHPQAPHISPNSTAALTQALALQEAVYDQEDATYGTTAEKRRRTGSTSTTSKSKAKAKTPSKAKAAAKGNAETKTKATAKGGEGVEKARASRKSRAKKVVEVVEEGGDTAYRGKQRKAKKVVEGGDGGEA